MKKEYKKLSLLELCDGVKHFYVAHDHCAAAVAVYAKVVEDFLFAFAFFASRVKFFPEVRDWFAAAPASNWDYHVVSS